MVEAKIMKAKKNYGYAKLMNIIQSSDERISARCPVARQCGGCQIQEMSYDSQLAFKHEKVRNNLIRLGDISPEMLDKVMEPYVAWSSRFDTEIRPSSPLEGRGTEN